MSDNMNNQHNTFSHCDDPVDRAFCEVADEWKRVIKRAKDLRGNGGAPDQGAGAHGAGAADAHGAGAADAADAHGIPQSYPSICIPRTWSNVTWSLVKDAFEEIFGDGSIERVDVVPRQAPNGEYFNKIFIHFVKWPETEYAQNIRQSLLDGKTIKLVYQFPWYWKCVLSNLPKRRWKGPAPYMEVLEDSHTQTKTELNLVEEGFAPFSNVGGEGNKH